MAKREIKSLEDLAAYFERRAKENTKRMKTGVYDEVYYQGKASAYKTAARKTRELIERGKTFNGIERSQANPAFFRCRWESWE